MEPTYGIVRRTLTMKIYGACMEPAQEAHLNSILSQVTGDLRAKYEAGQEAHGGNLWEKPGMLEQAIAEVLDLCVYLYTLRDQRDSRRLPNGRDT